jgi:hypothetical protein
MASTICGDLNASGSIGASDALLLLKGAVGQDVTLSCECAGSSGDCGNGVRDDAEECEALDGCTAQQLCTSSCTCQDIDVPMPTSQDLIAQALDRGDIDYPTSILYRVWALHMAPDLPEEFDGAGTAGEDIDLDIELSHVRGTLPAEIEAAILPYLVRPTNPLSVYSAEPSAASLRAARAAGAPSPINCPSVGGKAAWVAFETAHFVVWSCGVGRCVVGKPATTACELQSDCDTAPGELDGQCETATPAARRLVVGAIAEEIYPRFVADFGPPRGDDYDTDDAGPHPRNRIDIYMLRPNECRSRGGSCVSIDGSIAAAFAATPCGRQNGGPLTSSGYALVNADDVPALAPGAEGSKFRGDLVHELFHVWEYGLNAEVIGKVCNPTNVGQSIARGRTWLTEASAEWSTFGYYPEDDKERRETLFRGFQVERDPAEEGLHATGFTPPLNRIRPYEAALYLQFLQQETGSRQPIVDLWTTSQAARTKEAFDTHLDSIAPFRTRFREFAVSDLNKDLLGAPLPLLFSDLDDARPEGVEPRLLLPSPLLLPDVSYGRFIDVAPLFSRYELYRVHEATRHVRVDVSDVPGAEYLHIDAVVKVGSQWERRKVEGPVFEFCREDEGDDISLFYLVLSNHDHRREGRIDSDYSVETKSSCPGGWTGHIRMVYTFDESRVDVDQSGSSQLERHEREEQTWTVVKTELVKPPNQALTVEQLTTTFQVVSWIDEWQSWTRSCSGAPPRLGTRTSTRTANSGFAGTSFFQVFPLPAGTFSLTPVAPGQEFQLPVTFTSHDECDGITTTTNGSKLISQGFGYLTLAPGLTYLTPLPNDPGHFAGSDTVLHHEMPVAGGMKTIDVTVSWDLQRKLAR